MKQKWSVRFFITQDVRFFSDIEKLRLTVSSNLAEKETASAQLRTEHTNCRFELQMCQANLEKLVF